ncbi:hypothetical protein V8C86DRAFT_606296 [Haematococcus lacustris]
MLGAQGSRWQRPACHSILLVFVALVLQPVANAPSAARTLPTPSQPTPHRFAGSASTVEPQRGKGLRPNVTAVARGELPTNATLFFAQGACVNALTARRQAACQERNGAHAESGPIFKDRQAALTPAYWKELQDSMEAAPAPAWMQDEDLAPYLYDMDYEMPGSGDPTRHSHLWDPELRTTGNLHCLEPRDCITPYLPELYYFGDEYMGGWAMEGLDGDGLRAAIGPNIAAGTNPSAYNYTYIPYTQRIIFSPSASLFFPYLFSIYAGQVYIATTSTPLQTAAAVAARAGVVLDYFYTLDEYTSYNFISFGPAATASAAVTARARGIISAVAKAEAFTQSIWTLTRDDYADRTRQSQLLSDFFVGASAAVLLNNNGLQINSFLPQPGDIGRSAYTYDYAGSQNPFPLTSG